MNVCVSLPEINNIRVSAELVHCDIDVPRKGGRAEEGGMKDRGGQGGEEGVSGLNANDSLRKGNYKHTLLAQLLTHKRVHKHNEHNSAMHTLQQITHSRKQTNTCKNTRIYCVHTLSVFTSATD